MRVGGGGGGGSVGRGVDEAEDELVTKEQKTTTTRMDRYGMQVEMIVLL